MTLLCNCNFLREIQSDTPFIRAPCLVSVHRKLLVDPRTLLSQQTPVFDFRWRSLPVLDGLRERESGGVSGHGLFLRAGGAASESCSEKHSLRGGSVQDVERRRVSF